MKNDKQTKLAGDNQEKVIVYPNGRKVKREVIANNDFYKFLEHWKDYKEGK